jgi:hypothetical protein
MRFFCLIGLAAGLALSSLAAAPALSQQEGPAREGAAASVQDAQPSAADSDVADAASASVVSMACRIQCPSDPNATSSVSCTRVSEEECRATAAQASSCRVDYIFESWCASREVSASAADSNP